ILELRLRRFDDLAQQLTHVHRPALDRELARLQAGDVEELPDQPPQLVRLYLNGPGRPSGAVGAQRVTAFELAGEQLRVPAQARHRRLQLVGRYREELVAQAYRRPRFPIQARVVDGQRTATRDVFRQVEVVRLEGWPSGGGQPGQSAGGT